MYIQNFNIQHNCDLCALWHLGGYQVCIWICMESNHSILDWIYSNFEWISSNFWCVFIINNSKTALGAFIQKILFGTSSIYCFWIFETKSDLQFSKIAIYSGMNSFQNGINWYQIWMNLFNHEWIHTRPGISILSCCILILISEMIAFIQINIRTFKRWSFP